MMRIPLQVEWVQRKGESILAVVQIKQKPLTRAYSSSVGAHSNNLNTILQSAVLKSSGNANHEDCTDHPNIMYRVPERVHQDNTSKCGDRSSTASSFSAWRSNCRNPIYSSRCDELWPRLEYWWNLLKWPLVLLLICSILGLFIYFLVIGK